MRPGTALLIMFPLVLVAGAFVLVASRGAGAADLHTDGVWWDEAIAQFVRRKIALTYVDDVDDERASRAFYKAMDAYLRELDEWCDFIPPEEHRKWKEETHGEYAGLAIKIREEDDGLVVMGLLPGGPAARAGLQVGDTILAADGHPLGRASGEKDLTRLLKGAPDTTVRLLVAQGPRPAQGPAAGARREVVATRAVVRPPSVFTRRVGKDGQFGVIRLTEFNDLTADDFDRALETLLQAGVKAMMIDLRYNGGGVLPSAVRVVDRFLSSGMIVRMEGRGQGASSVRNAQPDPKDVPDTVPLVVLVNGGSASASEVVAGALQDHRRALLVGERTYGKFLVQQITDLPNRDAALQITTSRYYTPSGRSYQRRAKARSAADAVGVAESDEPAGLLPDIVVPLETSQKELLAKAFDDQEGAAWGEVPAHPEVPAGYVDPQMAKAMEVLEGELVLRKLRRSAR